MWVYTFKHQFFFLKDKLVLYVDSMVRSVMYNRILGHLVVKHTVQFEDKINQF